MAPLSPPIPENRPPPPEPEISNPPVAEGINAPDRDRQGRAFLRDAAIIVAAILLFIGLVNLVAILLVPFIPFSWERGLVPDSMFVSQLDAVGSRRQEELRRLADTLAATMDLPEGMTVTVHYDPGGTENAYASLGGNIVVHQGIIDLMDSEDELAMVVAHEIGHVKNRDALKGMARGVGVLLVLIGLQDSGVLVEKIAQVSLAGYSRGQERAADSEALRALARVYGHTGGGRAFFTAIVTKLEGRSVAGNRKPLLPSIMASHPDSMDRLDTVREEAEKNRVPADGEPTPLPAVFRRK